MKKTSVKKTKSSIYLRYEFSDEVGHPEGGDIFEFPSFKHALELADEILKVSHGDDVAVNVTIGTEKPFFGYLGNSGLSRKAAEKEMVKQLPTVAPTSTQGKAQTKTTAKKAPAKKSKAKTKK